VDAIKARQAIAIMGILGEQPAAFAVLVRPDGRTRVVHGLDVFEGDDLVDALAQFAQTVDLRRAVSL
jgi:hypothetical protein